METFLVHKKSPSTKPWRRLAGHRGCGATFADFCSGGEIKIKVFIFSFGIHLGRLELIVWHRQGTFLQRKAIQRSLNCRKNMAAF